MATKLLPVAAAAGAVALAVSEMTNAAAEDAAQQARLEAAVKAAGAATGDYTTQIDDAITAGQAKAFSDDQTREALMSLVTATGDVTSATAELAVAQDIARFANVDLATAADAVAKANAGQDAQLAKLLPGMEKGATAADTLAAATAAAAGQADTYANSAKGMQEKGADAFGELGETLGTAFLPIVEALVPVLTEVLGALAKLLQAVIPPLIPLIKLLVVPIKLLADVLVVAVGWLTKMIDKLLDAAGAIGRFLDQANPLKNFKLPSLPFLSAASAPLPRAVALAGQAVGPQAFGSSSGHSGAVTLNFYTTGDSIDQERAVASALRRVQRLNAGMVLPSAGRTA